MGKGNESSGEMAKRTGCRVCEAICSLVKEGEFNPVKARGKVVRTVERSILHKVRVTCLQCGEPNCMAVCPSGAITATDEGVKVVNEEKCIGCKMCEMACPVGAALFVPEPQLREILTTITDDYPRLCPQCRKIGFSNVVSGLALSKKRRKGETDRTLEMM